MIFFELRFFFSGKDLIMIDICISEKKENKFYSIDLHDKMPLILSLCTYE